MRLTSICAFTLAALVTPLTACAADAYPVRPIRVLAGGAAGGPIDIMARVVGQKLSDSLGQSLVIDNRGGAGGTIATRIAAQSVPDGYTLLCNSSQYAAAASLYKNPGYDPFKDFAPIINAGVSPNMIFVHPSVTATNLQELIALGKKQKLSYGSAGAGSTPHLTGERLLKIMAGLEVTHIPYSSAAPAMLAVAARAGAPLGHDFCALSLSDNLKPWELIERRLDAAAEHQAGEDRAELLYHRRAHEPADHRPSAELIERLPTLQRQHRAGEKASEQHNGHRSHANRVELIDDVVAVIRATDDTAIRLSEHADVFLDFERGLLQWLFEQQSVILSAPATGFPGRRYAGV